MDARRRKDHVAAGAMGVLALLYACYFGMVAWVGPAVHDIADLGPFPIIAAGVVALLVWLAWLIAHGRGYTGALVATSLMLAAFLLALGIAVTVAGNDSYAPVPFALFMAYIVVFQVWCVVTLVLVARAARAAWRDRTPNGPAGHAGQGLARETGD
jgi:hypothetical protein